MNHTLHSYPLVLSLKCIYEQLSWASLVLGVPLVCTNSRTCIMGIVAAEVCLSSSYIGHCFGARDPCPLVKPSLCPCPNVY